MKRLCLAFVAFSFVASAAAAQSLAEVARQEQARRKAIKTPSKVYTDADLRRLAPITPPSGTVQPQPLAPAPAAGEEAKPSGQQADAQATAQAAEGKAAGDPAPEKDETWWRNRITEARAQLDSTKFLCDAMQTRINSLTNDWTARDDPAQRAVLANDRDKALRELQRLQKDIDTQTKAIAAIEEEARRAGVPPGWLR